MGQTIFWWDVEAALATSVVAVNGLARKKLEQAGFRSWGNVLVTGFRKVCSIARLNEEESGALLLGLEQFNHAFFGKLRYELTFRTWYTVRIRARYMLKRELSGDQYARLFATKLQAIEWLQKEKELLAKLKIGTVGQLCQIRWEGELLPAIAQTGMTVEELRVMEDRFFRWGERFKVGLVFDMDLPAPFSNSYPRALDPKAPGISREVAYQIANSWRRVRPAA